MVVCRDPFAALGMASTTSTSEVEPWSSLSDDIMGEILSQLPLQTLALASCVCRRWRSIAASQKRHDHDTWLYVDGHRYNVTPPSYALPQLLDSALHPPLDYDASWGAGGLCYVLSPLDTPSPSLDTSSASLDTLSSSSPDTPSPQKLLYTLDAGDAQWIETPPMRHPRISPIVAVVRGPKNESLKVVCAGGRIPPLDGTGTQLRLQWSLKVEVFSSESQRWEECEDLPAEFDALAGSGSGTRSNSLVRTVAAAVWDGKLHVYHIHSGRVAVFDPESKRWSVAAMILRPPAQLASPRVKCCYLVADSGGLLLVGVSYESHGFVFGGWRVDASKLECGGDDPPVPLVCHFPIGLGRTSACRAATAPEYRSSQCVQKLAEQRFREAPGPRRLSLPLQCCIARCNLFQGLTALLRLLQIGRSRTSCI